MLGKLKGSKNKQAKEDEKAERIKQDNKQVEDFITAENENSPDANNVMENENDAEAEDVMTRDDKAEDAIAKDDEEDDATASVQSSDQQIEENHSSNKSYVINFGSRQPTLTQQLDEKPTLTQLDDSVAQSGDEETQTFFENSTAAETHSIRTYEDGQYLVRWCGLAD